MGKIMITKEQHDKLFGLWDKACIFENKDPDLEGAFYIFQDNNPCAKEYEAYKRELEVKR